MADMREKAKRFNKKRPNSGRRPSTKQLFFVFQEGPNDLRLVGEFLEVKTHFIAPAPKRKERGLCMPASFDSDGERRLPPVINCSDWDVDKEDWASEKTCTICKLRRAVDHALKSGKAWDGLSDSEKKEKKELYEKTAHASNPRTSLKWNMLDRRNPMVVELTDEGEKEVLGYKIASIGMEAWNDISGIFSQLGIDITNVDDGVDICVTRGSNGVRTVYSAVAVMDGLSAKQTPLTDEERALELHDLRRVCGRQVEQDRVLEALHGDLRDIIDVYEKEVGNQEPEREAQNEAQGKEKGKGKDKGSGSDDSGATESEGEFDQEPEKPKEPEKPEKAEEDATTPKEAESSGDASANADGENWECFGTCEPDHPECQVCKALASCAEKTGVEVKPKKGKKARGS